MEMTSITQRLESAILWATEVHAGEARDGAAPLPYIAHPVEVLSLVRYVGGVVDEDVLCAAVLHDVVETDKVAIGDVAVRFGDRTRDLVAELTRTEPTAEQIEGLDEDAVWELRAGLLLDDVRRMSPEAQTIKLADRISNLAGALATKRGSKLKRHLRQTKRLLKAISKKANAPLRKMLKDRLSAAKEAQKIVDRKAPRCEARTKPAQDVPGKEPETKTLRTETPATAAAKSPSNGKAPKSPDGG